MTKTPDWPNGWAKLVGELRAREGWTQDYMGTLVGVNRNTIRRWESGETANVSTASIRLFATAAGIDFSIASQAVDGAKKALLDDETIAEVRASDWPDAYKDEIVQLIERERAEAEEALRRRIDLLLRRPPVDPPQEQAQ